MAVATVLALASLGAGYLLGARSRFPVTESLAPSPPPEAPRTREPGDSKPYVESEDEDEEDFEDIEDGDLAAISAGFNEPCKLVRHF